MQFVNDGPWGWRVLRFDGTNDHMRLQRQSFGSSASACLWVRYNQFKQFSNVFNFHNGVSYAISEGWALYLI